jgi:hypothetical protein
MMLFFFVVLMVGVVLLQNFAERSMFRYAEAYTKVVL